MTARTYAYCIGEAPIPWELQAQRAVEQFGVPAVFGRDILTPAEINGMRIANAVQRVYHRMTSAENWAAWAEKNPDEAKFLEAAQKIWTASK